MAIKYVMRSGVAGVVDGIAIPALGLVVGYANEALEPYTQDVLGATSPLVKSGVESLADGAPEALDTLAEIATALDTKLTATPATAEAAIGVTVDLAIASPVAVDLNAVFSDTEVEAALGAKADQAAVSDTVTAIEGRLDVIEAKVDAVIAALKAAGIMAS